MKIQPSAIETALKKDRIVVTAGLASVVLLAWLYILLGAGMEMDATRMTRSGDTNAGMPMPMDGMSPANWSASYGVLMFFMWWIMMIAMMTPSAAPMILLFAAFNRKQHERGLPYVPTAIFAAGYLLAWGGFSVLATGAQWTLQRESLLSPMMMSNSAVFGSVLLIAAGLYQLTPLKHACLRHCRSPLHFISHHWRKGKTGALRMGIEHGVFCLGCCWALMGLLFFGGVMNLYWIIGLAVFVLLEKSIPAGHWLGRLTGAGLITWGGWLISGAS